MLRDSEPERWRRGHQNIDRNRSPLGQAALSVGTSHRIQFKGRRGGEARARWLRGIVQLQQVCLGVTTNSHLESTHDA